MNNCLTTRLKESVTDNSFPIFESMQQFTLDAITASGNDNLTDAQKSALNHYFYQIGAFDYDENSIWSKKIDKLFIPSLAGGLANQGYDYKNSRTDFTVNRTGFTDTHHGLEYTGTGTKNVNMNNLNTFTCKSAALLNVSTYGQYIGTNKNFTMANAFQSLGRENTQLFAPYNAPNAEVGCKSGEVLYYKSFSNEPDFVAMLMNITNVPYTTEGNTKGYLVKENGTIIYGFQYGNSGTFDDTSEITPSNSGFSINSGIILGIIIVFKAGLTDDEVSKVISSSLALRSALAFD